MVCLKLPTVANNSSQSFLSVSSILFKSFSRQSVDGSHLFLLGKLSYCTIDHSFTGTGNWETFDRLVWKCCCHSLYVLKNMNVHTDFVQLLQTF